MPKLCVNVDHVATIRQARRTNEPDPVAAALIAERSGAIGITIHLREDRRHIQDRDLRLMREVVRGKLNLEMAPVDEMIKIALEIRPDQATLVPERREEITTEGGLDAAGQVGRLSQIIEPLSQAGILVSLFIDPDASQLEAAQELGVDYVELNTAAYSETKAWEDTAREMETLRETAERAHAMGLGVHAGHGLTYLNVAPAMLAASGTLEGEDSITFGATVDDADLVANALVVGFESVSVEFLYLQN